MALNRNMIGCGCCSKNAWSSNVTFTGANAPTFILSTCEYIGDSPTTARWLVTLVGGTGDWAKYNGAHSLMMWHPPYLQYERTLPDGAQIWYFFDSLTNCSCRVSIVDATLGTLFTAQRRCDGMWSTYATSYLAGTPPTLAGATRVD